MTTPFDGGAPTIRVTFGGRTDPGQRRDENQDNFVIADLGAGDLDAGFLLYGGSDARRQAVSRDITLGPKGALVLVADGMGGAAAGATASRMAVAWIYRTMATDWGSHGDGSPATFARRLRQAMEEANARIHEEGLRNPGYRGMGTTATAVGILGGRLFIGQVGDSRAYLARGGRVVQLTRDQSLVQQLVEAGALTEAEAEHSVHGTVILQALGTQPDVKVELTHQELRRGDVLLVCSDGLSRVVRKEELAQAVLAYPDPAELCGELVALANRRGGPDNITVVAARVDGEGLAQARDDDVVGRHEYVIEDEP